MDAVDIRAQLGDDWRNEQIAYEINRLNRILRCDNVSECERTIAQNQLDFYLKQTEHTR
jgi:hypothetical protein